MRLIHSRKERVKKYVSEESFKYNCHKKCEEKMATN